MVIEMKKVLLVIVPSYNEEAMIEETASVIDGILCRSRNSA